MVGGRRVCCAPARLPPPFPMRGLLPPSSLGLVVSSRGAKSSHNSRALARGRSPFSGRGLLPSPREALFFRLGEQNLHTIPAPPLGARRLFPGAVCSPLLARPCGSVSGSKIFTQFPRPRPGAAAFSRARFAPTSSLGLVIPSGGSKIFTQFPRPRRVSAVFSRARFAPPSLLSLVLPSRGAKSSHNSRAPAGCPPLFSGRRPLFPGRGLLPSPR